MNLKKPVFTKQQLLELTNLPSSTFNNWRIRGLIPFADLGHKMESLTRFKYSPLTAAYCKALSYHTGQNRKLYIRELQNLLTQFARQSRFNPEAVIAISGWGKANDCGTFDSLSSAMALCPHQCVYVPVGKIIKQYVEVANEK